MLPFATSIFHKHFFFLFNFCHAFDGIHKKTSDSVFVLCLGFRLSCYFSTIRFFFHVFGNISCSIEMCNSLTVPSTIYPLAWKYHLYLYTLGLTCVFSICVFLEISTVWEKNIHGTRGNQNDKTIHFFS